MELVQIKYGTPLHEEEIKLRDKVLREPLGLKFSKEDLASEKEELRYALLDPSGKLAACLLIRVLSNSHVRLRQMAVREELRGKGVGSELVEKVESELKNKFFNKIELHSRKYAEGFYKKIGYSPSGNTFTEVGIPHIKMTKKL